MPFFRVGPIGSRNATATFFNTDHGAYVQAGCFFGPIKEFSAKVKETHGDNQHAKDYGAAIRLAKAMFKAAQSTSTPEGGKEGKHLG